MRNLSFASRVLLLGRPDMETVTDFDPDALIFFAGVTSNGGTIDAPTQTAVSDLFAGLKSDGVWSRLVMVCPLAGDQLAGAMVAYRPSASAASVMTNVNFVSGDYSLAGGLQGDGTRKYVDTGCDIPSLDQDSISLGAWVLADSSANGNTHPLIASSYSATGDANRFYIMGGGNDGGEVGLGSEDRSPGSYLPTGKGWYLQSYNGATHTGYRGEISEFNNIVSGLTWQESGTVFSTGIWRHALGC